MNAPTIVRAATCLNAEHRKTPAVTLFTTEDNPQPVLGFVLEDGVAIEFGNDATAARIGLQLALAGLRGTRQHFKDADVAKVDELLGGLLEVFAERFPDRALSPDAEQVADHLRQIMDEAYQRALTP